MSASQDARRSLFVDQDAAVIHAPGAYSVSVGSILPAEVSVDAARQTAICRQPRGFDVTAALFELRMHAIKKPDGIVSKAFSV